MLGIFLIYFIWKKYADLALEFDKSRWGFGILGIVAYYFGVFLCAFVLGGFEGAGMIHVSQLNPLLQGLMCMPLGIASCVGTFMFLKKKWERGNEDTTTIPGIIDQDLPE